MRVLRRPGPRFVVEALAIVLAAVLTGLAHLPWWEIALAVLAVLIVAFIVESLLSQPAAPKPAPAEAPAPAPAAAPAPEPEEARPHVRVLAPLQPEPSEPPEPEPQVVSEPVAAPEPEPAPVPEPVAVASQPPPIEAKASLTAAGPWNIWEIERVLRERGDTDQERRFLVHFLRDYAGPDGELPGEFDDLVRESFGSLLAS
jgi:hypothetical protein